MDNCSIENPKKILHFHCCCLHEMKRSLGFRGCAIRQQVRCHFDASSCLTRLSAYPFNNEKVSTVSVIDRMILTWQMKPIVSISFERPSTFGPAANKSTRYIVQLTLLLLLLLLCATIRTPQHEARVFQSFVENFSSKSHFFHNVTCSEQNIKFCFLEFISQRSCGLL